MLRLDATRKTFSAEIKHRVFGRVHLALNTKARTVAMTRFAALQQLLDTGEPVRDVVTALRARKITIESVAECVRSKRPFDTLRASTWPTLGDAVADYVQQQRDREAGSTNTADGSDVALKHALTFFGADRPIESITYEDVSAYRLALKASDLATNTIALYILKLGAVYTYLQRVETRKAQQAKRLPAVLFSPIDRVEHMPRVQKTRVRFLLEDEASRILTVTPEHYTAAVALGLFAGLRLGEVAQLRVGVDVDLEHGIVHVQGREGWVPKYRKNRAVPISTALRPYLDAHVAGLPEGTLYLFPGRSEDEPAGNTTISGIFRTVVKNAEVSIATRAEAVTFHTLRHTFASWLVMAGADVFTVARLMGHTSSKQVEETYAHLSPEHRHATVELLSTRWRNRVGPTAAGE